MSRAWIIALALGLGGWTSSLASTLAVYPPPPVPQTYAWHNDDFTVRVRFPGGEWQDLYEYRIRVDWDRPQDASLVYFDFTGAVRDVLIENLVIAGHRVTSNDLDGLKIGPFVSGLTIL